jgi:hypothetical protein
VGPASWIEHQSQTCYFGPKVDIETDGNGGKCPAFSPNLYNQDEKQLDGDAGLIKPRAYTINTTTGTVGALNFTVLESLGSACLMAVWDATIDIDVTNNRPDRREVYVNILFDWDQDGKWQGSAQCPDGPVPEHVLVNFPVPAGYSGPLSALRPPSFKIGPLGGYVWARFMISERKVLQGWNGDGVFADGETEDYLLKIHEPLKTVSGRTAIRTRCTGPNCPTSWRTGMDVSMFSTSLADDFRCTQNSPITDSLQGSFLNDQLPPFSVDSWPSASTSTNKRRTPRRLEPARQNCSGPGNPAVQLRFHDVSTSVKRAGSTHDQAIRPITTDASSSTASASGKTINHSFRSKAPSTGLRFSEAWKTPVCTSGGETTSRNCSTATRLSGVIRHMDG